ncbi:MFS transporter [Enterococcus mundtii]|uniref:MFS transporter n=1 Tax=Enterococcus TaxID=1350 RepID=UPI0004474CE3|nr:MULTISPECIES: MFS transporter [Enterococcus]MCW6016488.1 MFS transporter [Serratia marcescens]EYT94897.1 MFS transporter [Enterococcus mundtii CRL35]MDA9427827.1 putative metabolite transport protein [Enterococcus mundtii 1A]MDK4210956.1 MFS transporter [Enterococcus mundtii]MDO7879381.1 MFS transporter [Enterococcus mundtii]
MEASKQKQAVRVSDTYWIKVVAIFFIGWILMYATRTIFNPIMGVVGEEFGLSNTQLGLANSIFFLTYAIAQIPFGIVGDKIGRKLVITVGFLLLAVATYFTGLATTFILFLVIRAIAGIGQGAYYGPQFALSTEAIPKSKRTIGNAIINSGMAFGTSGGYLLSSKLVLENGDDWSKPFYLMAIPTLIVGILFYVFLKEKVIRPGEEAEVEEGPKEKISLKQIFTNRNLVAAFILCFTSIYANFVILTWLPQFLIAERGFTGASVGFISSLVPWASIPGALLFARINDKTGATKKLVFVLVPLAIVSVFAIAFVTNRTLLITVLILYGLTGKLALDPIMVTFVTKHAPRAALGTTLSAYNFIGMSGSILAPYVTGYLADTSGSMQVGFYLSCVLLIIGLILFALLAKEDRTQTLK